MKKSKRDIIEKDCTKWGITDIYLVYKKKLESKTNPKIHHLARLVYSDYLLLSKRIDKDNCKCVTCGDIKHRDNPQMQPGHYRRAGESLKYKFVDDNVWPQCYRCNCIYGGQYRDYKTFIINKFGSEWEEHTRTDKSTHTIRGYEYAEMTQKWREYSGEYVINHLKNKK